MLLQENKQVYNQMMGEFVVHNIRFFDFKPEAIQTLAFEENNCRLALSRSDNSIEIWDLTANPYQEKRIPGQSSRSVTALTWCKNRLFSTGFHGDLTEYDLMKLCPKKSYQVSSTSCWCMKLNSAGNILAIGTEDGYICLYEVTDDEVNFLQYMSKQNGRLVCLAWHCSGDYIVSGSIDDVYIWNVKDGSTYQQIIVGRTETRKETIIWSIIFTDDFQIITGDSTGAVSFWNGQKGTLMQSFKSHKADVLTLCINKMNDVIFASGIDSKLICFEKNVTASGNVKKWIKTSCWTYHTHDVKAITFGNDYLISGGNDTSLRFLHVSQNLFKASCLPQHSVVHFAPQHRIVLFQYTDSLELWKLGNTSKDNGTPNEILPLSESVLKLITLKSKGSEAIVCCAISKDARWLAYSTFSSIRIFEIQMDTTSIVPKLSLTRIKYELPEGPACNLMAFAPHSSHLFLAKANDRIQVLDVNSAPVLLHTYMLPTEHCDSIHLLDVSPDGLFLAIADHSSNIHIFNNKTRVLHCTLPKHHFQPTAMAFNPSSSNLIIIYTNQQIVEYSIKKEKFTPWTVSTLNFDQTKFHHKQNPTLRISFNGKDDDNIIVHDDDRIWIINKLEVLAAANSQKKKERVNATPRRKKKSRDSLTNPEEPENLMGFHSSSKYKHLLHFSLIDKGVAVAVEVSEKSIWEKLPDTLVRKKFGT